MKAAPVASVSPSLLPHHCLYASTPSLTFLTHLSAPCCAGPYVCVALQLPAHWMNEKDVKECLECHLPFNSLLRRKHHCRVCGKVVCFSCCQNNVGDPAHPNTGRLRACNTCYVRSMVASVDGQPHLSILPPSSAPPSPTPPPVSHRSLESDNLSAQPPTITAAMSPSSSMMSTHSRSLSTLNEPTHPSRPISPLLDPTHPLPMPVFTSNNVVDNTVATVTAMILEEEANAASHSDPDSSTLTLPHSSPSSSSSSRRPSSSLSTPLTVSHGIVHPADLHIVVPPKELDGPDALCILPSTSSEPVSPSRALEQHLRENGTGHSPLPPASPLLSPDPSTSPTAPHSPSEEQIVLDLPMKLCLVILKKSAAEMKVRYSEYLRTKEARHEVEPLSFQQFMFFSTIRTLPDFVYKKTDLAYCMMRDEGSQIVHRDAFVRYAPILPPLASKLDAGTVFDVLALELPAQQGMLKGVSLALFKQFVDNLHKEFNHDISRAWEGWREEFELPKSELLLFVRHGVSDTTHFPPHMGTVGVTNHHILYSSVFKKKRCIAWADVVKVEKNEDGFLRRHEHAGIRLHFLREGKDEREREEKEEKAQTTTTSTSAKRKESNTLAAPTTAHSSSSHSSHTLFHQRRHSRSEEKDPVKVINWDVPGIGSESLHAKQRFFLQLRILHASHRLSEELITAQPLTAAALLQESFDLVRRMKALESIAPHVEPLKLNPYGDFSDAAQQDWVRRIRDVVKKTERVKDSKKSWLTNILPGLSGAAESKGVKQVDDIDPEFKPAYKTMEEMNEEVKEAEPFSVKAFSYNVKLFARQVQPLIALMTLVQQVRNWDNPLLTFGIVAFLLNMAYRDFLVYLPAIAILANIAAILIFRLNPDVITQYLDALEKVKEEEELVEEESTTGSAPVIISTVAGNAAASPGVCATVPLATAVTVVRKKDTGKDKEHAQQHAPVGLLAKLKEYRDVAVKTKDHLETVQHGLAAVNLKTLRVEGLFKWNSQKTTGKFLGILCALFVVMVVVPFRFIFPIILIDWVTDKWQKEGSQLDRLLQEVPLPEELPEMD